MSTILTDTTQSGHVSFEAFHEQYYALVRKRAYYLLKNRQDAEDVAQETFLKVHRNWEKVDKSGNVRAWLWMIVTNTVRDFIRSHKRYANDCSLESLLYDNGEEHLTVLSSLEAGEPDMLDTLIARETCQRALAQISALDRHLLMHFARCNTQREVVWHLARLKHLEIPAACTHLMMIQHTFRRAYQEEEAA